MMYTKRIITLFTLLCVGLALWAQPNDKEAVKLVNQAIEKLEKSALNVSFTMNYQNTIHETNQIEFGNCIIFGERFYFNMAGIETFYDGKTQWVYMADINEVTVSEPIESELKDINPLAMMKYYTSNHRIALDEELSTKDIAVVNLYPHSKKEEYFMVTFLFSRTTQFPTKIVISQKNGDKIMFDWTSLSRIIKPEENQFVFVQSNYPKVIVNDLR